MSTIIQHADVNVGPANYKHFKKDELLVTKIFYTVQGEGPFAGHPAVFIRLAGCNRGRKEDMGCQFCDTHFTYATGVPQSFTEIEKELLGCLRGIHTSSSVKRMLVVITGGEPMMQDNLSWFVMHLADAGYRNIQIESNGDRLAPHFPYNGEITLVVSPKVTKNGYRVLRPDVAYRANALKFVVSADPDSPYHNVPEYAHGNFGVYVSPLTVYRKAHEPFSPVSAWDTSLVDHYRTKLNYQHAATLAMQFGFRLSMQQHLFFAVE